MARQAIKYGTQSLVLILLMAGILFFVNILSANFFTRADLTETKEFTITESTKKILSQMDDIVNIRLYFSKDLPPYLVTLENQVHDLLDEYRAYSKGNIVVEFIDPSNDPELKEKLQRLGIPELQLRVIEKDQQQIRKAYLGISIQFGDKSEVIPVIRSVENLEYDLTSALFKVTDSKDRILGWIGPARPDSAPNGYEEIQKSIEQEYMIRRLEPSNLKTIPQNIELVVVDGNQSLPDKALYAIDQYIMGGGKVVFMVDKLKLSEQGLSVEPANEDAVKLVSHYGIDLANALSLDRSNAYAAFNSGFVRFSLPYPFWPKIKPDGFNKSIPAVGQLESLVFPWVSGLEYPDNLIDRTVVSLVTSSSTSWRAVEPYDLNPQQKFDVSQADLKKDTFVVQVNGKFKSYFDGKTIPVDDSETAKKQDPKMISPDTSIMVIANTRFVTNQFSRMFPENTLFFQNIVDSLTIGDQLIGIRSRGVTSRELDYGSTDEKKIESIKTTHRVFGTFGVPLLIIIFGLFRFSLRVQRKKNLNLPASNDSEG